MLVNWLSYNILVFVCNHIGSVTLLYLTILAQLHCCTYPYWPSYTSVFNHIGSVTLVYLTILDQLH